VQDLTLEQKKELNIDETLTSGIAAIETHNSEHCIKAVIIKRGIIDYILNGD
jgi:hypothetical protein